MQYSEPSPITDHLLVDMIGSVKAMQHAYQRVIDCLHWLRATKMIAGTKAHVSVVKGAPGLHFLFRTREEAKRMLDRMQCEVEQTEFNICSSTGNYVAVFDVTRYHISLWVHYPITEATLI